MTVPGSRLFALLELLQTRPFVTGREIADELAVDRRTVRRYIATLQELGIPIEGERGVGGGYRLRPGFRLPPLMLGDDEAAAVVFGLVAAGRLGLATDGVDGALAKIHRVLPDTVRSRVEALESTLGFTTSPDTAPAIAGGSALLLADAVRRRRRIRVRYRTFEGDESRRELSPYGLVVHSGRWYLAAHDHGRDDLRTFRVDRIEEADLAAGAAAAAPEGFDAAEHVRRSLARVPWPWEVEVLLHLAPEEARPRLPASLAELEPDGERTLLRMRVSSLDWMAGVLAGLGCAFTIRRPDELRESVRALAERLVLSSDQPAR
jgi:predicted DNA-binding transcriptional regulator YafY